MQFICFSNRATKHDYSNLHIYKMFKTINPINLKITNEVLFVITCTQKDHGIIYRKHIFK
jgi:hypothetical protein